MTRPTVGWLALASLAVGVVLLLAGPQGSGYETWSGGSLRVGFALGALWLALPEIRQIPRWLYGVCLGLALIVALRPKFFLLAMILALATAFLRPRWNRRSEA